MIFSGTDSIKSETQRKFNEPDSGGNDRYKLPRLNILSAVKLNQFLDLSELFRTPSTFNDVKKVDVNRVELLHLMELK